MKRVLILDDEFDLAELLALLLRDEGFEVVTAGSVREALSAWEQTGHYDVLLVDFMLPDGTGADFIGLLEEREQLGGVQVVAMSAVPPQARPDALRDVPFLRKPFSLSELRAQLRLRG